MADLVFKSLRNNTFTISRRVRTTDGQGGWVITYTELGDVEGRMRPASSGEREVAAVEERQISHVLYVDAAETIQIQRGDKVELDSVSWEVMGRREPSYADHHYEIDCLQVQVEATEEFGS